MKDTCWFKKETEELEIEAVLLADFHEQHLDFRTIVFGHIF